MALLFLYHGKEFLSGPLAGAYLVTVSPQGVHEVDIESSAHRGTDNDVSAIDVEERIHGSKVVFVVPIQMLYGASETLGEDMLILRGPTFV